MTLQDRPRRRLLASLLAGLVLSTGLANGAFASDEERPPAPSFDASEGPLTSPAVGLDRLTRNVYDALVLRPFQLALLIGGGVAFVPTFPVAALFGYGTEATEVCLIDPAERVFLRPLGEL